MSFFNFNFSSYTKEEVLNSLINQSKSGYNGGYSFLSAADKEFVIKGINNAFIFTAFKAIIDLYSAGSITFLDFINKILNIVAFKIAKILSYTLYPLAPISRFLIEKTSIPLSQILLKTLLSAAILSLVRYTIIGFSLAFTPLSFSIILIPTIIFFILIELNLRDIINDYLKDSFNERVKNDIESYDKIHSFRYKAKGFTSIISKFIANLTAKISNFVHQDIVMAAMVMNNTIFDILSVNFIFNAFLNPASLLILIPVVATSYIINSLGYNISIHNASNTGKGIPNPEDVAYNKQINNNFPITSDNLQNLVNSLNKVERYNMKVIFLECIKILNICLTTRKFIDVYKKLHDLQGTININAPQLLNDTIIKSINDCISNGVFAITPGISIKDEGPIDDNQIKVVVNLIDVFKAINTAIDQYNYNDLSNQSSSMLNQYQANPESTNYDPELFQMVVYSRAKKMHKI